MHDRTAGASENRPEAEETGVGRAPAMSSEGPETTITDGGAASTHLLKAATAKEQGERDEQSHQLTRALKRHPFADLSAPLTGYTVDRAKVRCRPCDGALMFVKTHSVSFRAQAGKMSCGVGAGDSRRYARREGGRTWLGTGASPRGDKGITDGYPLSALFAEGCVRDWASRVRVDIGHQILCCHVSPKAVKEVVRPPASWIMAWALNSGRPWDTEILRLTEHVSWPGCGLPTMAQPDRFALSQNAHLERPGGRLLRRVLETQSGGLLRHRSGRSRA
ncbi:hypothetical protein VTN00DRAFT_558 [Thermoascus crustaceus]|uniref:uncharacterized protein n=1 Tax=Thermoascus crustaceus TaxID=5088 RepID=UPI003741E8DB